MIRDSGIPYERFEIQPKGVSINQAALNPPARFSPKNSRCFLSVVDLDNSPKLIRFFSMLHNAF